MDRPKEVVVDTILASFLIVWLSVLGYGAFDFIKPYVYMSCVDTFSQQTFTTDRTVSRISYTGGSYTLYKHGWNVTVISQSPNLVCSLSREYPTNAEEAITQPEEGQGQESASGYSSGAAQVN